MSRATLVGCGTVLQNGSMELRRSPLEVGSASLAVGAESVGLPTARSRETVLASYLDLMQRVRPGRDESAGLRQDDMQLLARVTGLDAVSVVQRLRSLSDKNEPTPRSST